MRHNHLLPAAHLRVSVVVTKSDEYRRLAQECLATAREVANEEKRTSLIHMAQVWLRLAEEQDASAPTAANESRPGSKKHNPGKMGFLFCLRF
jgi:hypothetical protein